MLRSLASGFNPKAYVSNPYVQSIAAYYWPGASSGQLERHQIPLKDGDALSATLQQASPSPSSRKVILIHGLAGCETSPYVLRACRFLLAAGFDVVRANLRGMGPGAPLAREAFHANRSEDVLSLISYFCEKFPESKIAVVGFSLGGVMLLKTAGKYDEVLPKNFDQLVSVSAPLELGDCVKKIRKFKNKIFDVFFIRKMRRYYTERKQLWGDETIDQLPMLLSIDEFDERVTSKKAGFRSALEYYRHASAKNWISKISRSSLLICAKDDPVIDSETYEKIKPPKHIEVMLTEKGGHVAFMNSLSGSESKWWLENLLVDVVKSLDHPAQ